MAVIQKMMVRGIPIWKKSLRRYCPGPWRPAHHLAGHDGPLQPDGAQPAGTGREDRRQGRLLPAQPAGIHGRARCLLQRPPDACERQLPLP